MNIRVSSLSNASAKSMNWADQVVSVVSPDTRLHWVDVAPRDHLVVFMHDTLDPNDDYAPTLNDVGNILGFVRDDSNVLVHCYAGIARSVAFAIGIGLKRKYPLADIINSIRKDSPNMWPNRLILGLIDQYMGLNGTLVPSANKVMAAWRHDLWLYCAQCDTNFVDGDNCPGSHWTSNNKD